MYCGLFYYKACHLPCLYDLVVWPSNTTCRKQHWYISLLYLTFVPFSVSVPTVTINEGVCFCYYAHGIIYKKPKLKHGYIFGGEFKSITNEHHFSSIGEHCQSAAAQVWVWPLALCCVSSPFTGLLSNKIKNKKGDEGDFLIIFLERPLIRLLVYSILCWFLLELLRCFE